MSTLAQISLEALASVMTPKADARSLVATHRAEIEDWLRRDLGIARMRETGSWHHGTAVTSGSDVDYFVTMPGSHPTYSSEALDLLRGSLQRGTNAVILTDRPAIRVLHYDGTPAMEITPAYFRQTDDYDIPDPDGIGWIRSNPAVHLAYVNESQTLTDGRAKNLIRLFKLWKGWNRVPLSSFYLEMRIAKYARENRPLLFDLDLLGGFRALANSGLTAMNDPTNYGRRISPGTGDLASSLTAKLAVDRALGLAEQLATAKDASSANYLMSQLFNQSALA